MITDEALKRASDAVVLAIQGYKPTTDETVALRQVIEAVFTAIVDLKVGDLKTPEPPPKPEWVLLKEPDGPGLWWVWTNGGWAPAFVSESHFRAQIGINAYPYWIKLPSPDIVP